MRCFILAQPPDDTSSTLASPHRSLCRRPPFTARAPTTLYRPPLWGPFTFLRNASPPSVTRGLWQAYAGSPKREAQQLGPRLEVRAALERLLAELPQCRICVSGHSLGGALATVCALDLLRTSKAVRERGVTLVSFAAPRFFNKAFQHATAALQSEGKLHPLRVFIPTDVVPRLPPRQAGGVHGVVPRLVLYAGTTSPSKAKAGLAPLAFDASVSDDDDLELWKHKVDLHAHSSHALYLGSECTPMRPQTIPRSEPWPVISRSLSFIL